MDVSQNPAPPAQAADGGDSTSPGAANTCRRMHVHGVRRLFIAIAVIAGIALGTAALLIDWLLAQLMW